VNLTAKSRYALKIMMDLAAHETEGHQQRAKMAARQSVPLEFMDQVLSRLREHDLIVSIRGRNGGVALKRPPAEISLWDIFVAVEDRFFPVLCVQEHHLCNGEEQCISSDAWSEVYSELQGVLASKNLKDLLAKWEIRRPPLDTVQPISPLCRGPQAVRHYESEQ
jgi:cysteine desulfurase